MAEPVSDGIVAYVRRMVVVKIRDGFCLACPISELPAYSLASGVFAELDQIPKAPQAFPITFVFRSKLSFTSYC